MSDTNVMQCAGELDGKEKVKAVWNPPTMRMVDVSQTRNSGSVNNDSAGANSAPS